MVFLPAIFPETDRAGMDFQSETSHGKNPYFGWRSFVGPPSAYSAAAGAGQAALASAQNSPAWALWPRNVGDLALWAKSGVLRDDC